MLCAITAVTRMLPTDNLVKSFDVTEALMDSNKYDPKAEHTYKLVVKAADGGKQAIDIYFDGEKIISDAPFTPSGEYMGIVAQQARDENGEVVITNIKVNGTVVAGVDYGSGNSKPESKPESGNSGSSTTTPPTGYRFPMAAIMVLGVSVLGFGVALSVKTSKKAK